MSGSSQKAYVVIRLIIILVVVDTLYGDPRSQIINLTCHRQRANNETIFISNFGQSMMEIGTQMQTLHGGTSSIGKGPNSNYGLAECYGDLSREDCILCYSEARTVLPTCFPNNGGQVYLDGCFMRTENYNFYQEYSGPDDAVICGNITRNRVFRDSVRQAVSDAVRDAPRNTDYFARKEVLSDNANESAYVMADCWNTLNETSCTECLENSFSSILKCLPSSEGRALHTGCFVRYSDTNFLNPELTEGFNEEGNAISKVIHMTCGNTRAASARFVATFLQTMDDIRSKGNNTRNGTQVAGTEPDSYYELSQCYGDISTHECRNCFSIARICLLDCLPKTSGRIYFNGCFMRYENYSFFEEYTGKEDKSICTNSTRRDDSFEQSVKMAVTQAVETAPKSENYHARTQTLISGTANSSVYAVANCWFTLNASSCAKCLQNAAKSMLECLPGSEGYALYTGCFMKYSESNTLYSRHNKLSKGKIIAMAVCSIVAFLLLSVIAFYAWKRRSNSKRRQGSEDTDLLKIVNSSSLNFKYSTIEKATSSFDEANKLGQGGFGTVYKGVLPNGKEIAVKRLFVNHRHRAGDFYNEVNIISSVDHKNLVKLIGFSCLGPESILVYEYLPNRSLDHFIFDAVRGKLLNWAKRFEIIVGIAEGLSYLHENNKTRIIHRDIKAANILLDMRLRAKIADFGLARSFQEDKNHISTGIAGTLGYMAPEYISHGKLTEKVDVYSFGVLILEVITGMPNRGIQTSDDTHGLILITWEHYKKGSVDELFDPNMMLNDQTSSKMKKEIESVVHIGLLCIQEVASLRPTMSMALQMLSKNVEPLPSPSNPPFVPENSIQLNKSIPIHALRLKVNNAASVGTVSHSVVIPR